MTTPTTKRVVKTPGQIDYELWWTAIGNTGSVEDGWSVMSSSLRDGWEKHAASLPTPIQPLTEDVPEPPKTDGELLAEAIGTVGFPSIAFAPDAVAAEFLRLRAERDGEPLEVTGDFLYERWNEKCLHADSPWDVLAEWINANRGVRPVPQVTAEMYEASFRNGIGWAGCADILNAELAKQAGKVGG